MLVQPGAGKGDLGYLRGVHYLLRKALKQQKKNPLNVKAL